MLFEPDDIFEVRTKQQAEKGAQQAWFLVSEKAHAFANTICPIHEKNLRHIWVGVCPRDRPASSNPSVARTLWCDLDSSVTTLEQARAAHAKSGLPLPTMIVNSGNGFHFYWKLKQAIPANDVRPYTKGVHQLLPTDSTHDPTRVMRVPGTANVKDPANPKPCFIEEHDPERVYDLAQFPKATDIQPSTPRPGAKPLAMKPLSDADRALFETNWMEGQKHRLAVAVSGYLRKNLYYDEASCEAEIAALSLAAGYPMDDNLRRVVKDTYAHPFGLVAGTTKLAEMGLFPEVRDAFTFSFKKPPKRRIDIIDFTEELTPQEFWVDGLVGPGLLTLWAAEPKTGKSFSAMQIGYALASGQNLWDFRTDGRKHSVLYFQGELSKGMVFERARNLFGVRAVQNPRQFAMTAKPPEPIDLVSSPEALTDLAEGYEVVIVDPISIFNTNDEQHSHSVNEVVSVFDSLRAQGKAVLLVHHTRKLQTSRDGTPQTPTMSDIRGSGAWFATADALALQYRTGDAHNTRVKFEFRAAPSRDDLLLFRLPHGGFTHDKHLYLQGVNTLRVRAASTVN